VRVHPIDTLSDIVGLRDPGRTWTLRDAMKRIAEAGTGVVIVLRDHASPRELADAVAALGQRAPPPATHAPPQVLRTYGIGAQILKDLGVTRMQVLSAPKQLQGIGAFGLEITGYVAE
jgi:3,4-dihydroxy 2-butanone 4-phosphate synthase / GTP cyclohydrolase II